MFKLTPSNAVRRAVHENERASPGERRRFVPLAKSHVETKTTIEWKIELHSYYGCQWYPVIKPKQK